MKIKKTQNEQRNFFYDIVRSDRELFFPYGRGACPHPAASGWDSVTYTENLFFSAAAFSSTRRTTLEYEWVRIFWIQRKKIGSVLI